MWRRLQIGCLSVVGFVVVLAITSLFQNTGSSQSVESTPLAQQPAAEVQVFPRASPTPTLLQRTPRSFTEARETLRAWRLALSIDSSTIRGSSPARARMGLLIVVLDDRFTELLRLLPVPPQQQQVAVTVAQIQTDTLDLARDLAAIAAVEDLEERHVAQFNTRLETLNESALQVLTALRLATPKATA